MSEIEVSLQKERSNVAGWISWARLERQLRRSAEIGDNEEITHMTVDADGIKYYVRKIET